AGGIGGIDAGVAEARRGDVARERAAAGARHGSAARRRVTRGRRGVPAAGTPPSAHQSCTVPSRRRVTGREAGWYAGAAAAGGSSWTPRRGGARGGAGPARNGWPV